MLIVIKLFFMGANCHKAFRIIFAVYILWFQFHDAALKAPVNFLILLSLLWLTCTISAPISPTYHSLFPRWHFLVATTDCHSHFHFCSQHEEEEGATCKTFVPLWVCDRKC